MESSEADLDLPGFRFHPTEEELLDFYLKHMVHGKKFHVEIIGTVNLYRYDPWELPRLAKIGEREWYFFVPRDRKHANGGRPNRTTEHGFWKATGSDRPIRSVTDPKRLIGLKKTLVFYKGRAPRGSKTDWVMNEYRLPDNSSPTVPPRKEDIVLCKIYRKATSLKELEQRAAMEEEVARASSQGIVSRLSSVADTVSISSDFDNFPMSSTSFDIVNCRKEEVKKEEAETIAFRSSSSSSMVVQSVNLQELHVPTTYGYDWMQDPFLTQLRSPWLDPLFPYSF